MASVTRPVPPQASHREPSSARPDPLHRGQRFSPAAPVPGGASSAGRCSDRGGGASVTSECLPRGRRRKRTCERVPAGQRGLRGCERNGAGNNDPTGRSGTAPGKKACAGASGTAPGKAAARRPRAARCWAKRPNRWLGPKAWAKVVPQRTSFSPASADRALPVPFPHRRPPVAFRAKIGAHSRSPKAAAVSRPAVPAHLLIVAAVSGKYNALPDDGHRVMSAPRPDV